jgi:Cdc6-like AAA superfamily ATPase
MCNKKKELLDKLRAMSTDEREALVERVYIKFPRIVDLLAKIKHCLEFSKISAEPECMVIKGNLGLGKTTLGKAFLRNYPRKVTEEETIIPVLLVKVPVPATPKGFTSRILKAFGDEAYDKGSMISQTLRIYDFVRDCKTDLIIFDDFQHFIDRDSLKVLRTLSDWLKNLIDETGKPIIVIGMPSCDAVLDEPQNEQLRRRFSIRECLEPFSWRSKDERRKLRNFLDLLDEQLPLLECSHLASINTAYLVHKATGGTIAYIMKLVRRAAALALRDGIEMIDYDHLAQAYEELLAKNNPKLPNPFVISTAKPNKPKRKNVKKAPSPTRTTSNRIKGRKKPLIPSDVLKKR